MGASEGIVGFAGGEAIGSEPSWNPFLSGRVPDKNSLTQAPWARSPVRRLVVGEVEGKQPKCRQRRKK